MAKPDGRFTHIEKREKEILTREARSQSRAKGREAANPGRPDAAAYKKLYAEGETKALKGAARAGERAKYNAADPKFQKKR